MKPDRQARATRTRKPAIFFRADRKARVFVPINAPEGTGAKALAFVRAHNSRVKVKK
jgi:hypothetical protein